MWDEAKVTFRSSNVSQNIVKYDRRHGLIWVENQGSFNRRGNNLRVLGRACQGAGTE